jgi:arylsulfatase A-like enzyme
MRLLYVDVDSLRPDHLSCYGYDRNTSPAIDSIADDGVRFERCYVSDSPCLPSRTALATCRVGAKTGVVTHHGTGQWYNEPGAGHRQDTDRPLSFRHLSEAGIHTATITSFDKRHLAYHFTGSFRESIQPTANTGLEKGPDVTRTATDWLDRYAADDDWLLHVNYWDVHHPYQEIGPFVDEIRKSGSAASWPDMDTIDTHQGMTGTRCADLWPTPAEFESDSQTDTYADWPMPDRIEDRGDAERIIDGYDASIRKVDTEITALLNALDAAGVREETAIVITADHGEALGEHGIYAEHAMAHPPCQRVPMIISWPGVTDDCKGMAVKEHIYQFDLLPTICDLAGIDVPAGWDAKSFTAALNSDTFNGRESLVCGHGIYTFSRAVYRDDWAFIRLIHPGVFSLSGSYNDSSLPGDGLELLYNLATDPHMTENLIAERPDLARDLRGELGTWSDRVTASIDAAGEDPLARMATTNGPWLYVDPDELAALYRDLDRSDRQVEAIERKRRW